MALYVNEQRIDESEIEQEFAGIKAHFESMANIQCCERDEEFKTYAKDHCIGRVLIEQEALRVAEAASDQEVDAALDELVKEHGGAPGLCLAYGLPMDRIDVVRTDIARRLQVNQFVDGMIRDLPPVDDAALHAYYQDHLDRYQTQERVRVLHILKAVSRVEERDDIYEQLRAVRRRVQAGEAFETLAIEFSDKAQEAREASARGDNPEEDQGIDLGFFARGELYDEVEIIAFSLEVGELSPVFTTTYGLHLIKVVDREPVNTVPFDQIVDTLREHHAQERRDAALADLVERLRQTAEIREVDEDDSLAFPI